MLGQKLTTAMAASVYAHKPFNHRHHHHQHRHQNLNNWFRSITGITGTVPPVCVWNSTDAASRPYSTAVDGKRGRLSGTCRSRWWRFAPRGQILLRETPHKILGFPGNYKSVAPGSGSFASSEGKGEFSAAGSSGSASSTTSGSGIVTDMGSESRENQAWCEDDLQSRNSSSSMRKPEQPGSKLLTLPTILTLGRVAAVPTFVCTFYVGSWWGPTATTTIFIAAAVTDWLDGFIARKMALKSAFGAFLDPVADKLMVAATLVLLCTSPPEVVMFAQASWLLAVPSIAIIGREITMSAVREWAAAQDKKLLEAVAVNNLGKWKTATQMTALTILLATRDSSLGGAGGLVASGVVFLYVSAGLALWSLVVYVQKIWRVLLR